jgi:hypothetical protein
VDLIIKLVPYGEDIAEPAIAPGRVIEILEKLRGNLEHHGHTWRDVSLLILNNSKSAASHPVQEEGDQAIKDGLSAFCDERGWHPSLIGCSSLSGFFRSPTGFNTDVSNGLLFTAVLSAVFERIPVVHEINRKVDERPAVGRVVLQRGIKEFRATASLMGVDLDEGAVTDSSTGLLFTTGSGHIRADQAVDFKECYAIGQELISAADDYRAHIVGGCASNRSEPQLQCLYYSEQLGARVIYKYTYQHGAVFTLLPYTRARLDLNHPYRRVEGVPKLELEFDPYDQYAPNRSFYVKRINGREPIDFLADYWHYTREELEQMATPPLTAIPAEPDAHWVTIGSSLSKRDEGIWPNIPVWLEQIDGQTMMRMVRAEDEDANYYLMELRPEALRENARDLMASLRSNFSKDVSMLTFVCESRKYVLNQMESNAEATEIVTSASDESTIVGIYLNGEYSTGERRSIGYHNYSQIGAVIPTRSVRDLPIVFGEAKVTAGLQLFACHSSRDKSTVREFMAAVQEVLRGSTLWIDEKDLLVGDVLKQKIQEAIGRGDQLVLPFLTDRSVKSAWVREELQWAVREEKDQKRTIILPVVLDDQGDYVLDELKKTWEPELVAAITERLHVKIHDFSEDEITSKGHKLARDVIDRFGSGGGHIGNPFRNL